MRHSTALRAERTLRLHVSDLVRAGLLKHRECSGDLWESGRYWGKYSATALLTERRLDDKLFLTFQRADWDFEAQQTVMLSWAKCPFVGTGWRVFFLCPTCGERVCFLYLAYGLEWRCRHCWRVINAEEIKTPRQRALGQLRKIRTHLGGSGDLSEPFPTCPRGMHRDAYERLRQRAMRYEEIARTIKPRRTREQMRAERLLYMGV